MDEKPEICDHEPLSLERLITKYRLIERTENYTMEFVIEHFGPHPHNPAANRDFLS